MLGDLLLLEDFLLSLLLLRDRFFLLFFLLLSKPLEKENVVVIPAKRETVIRAISDGTRESKELYLMSLLCPLEASGTPTWRAGQTNLAPPEL